MSDVFFVHLILHLFPLLSVYSLCFLLLVFCFVPCFELPPSTQMLIVCPPLPSLPFLSNPFFLFHSDWSRTAAMLQRLYRLINPFVFPTHYRSFGSTRACHPAFVAPFLFKPSEFSSIWIFVLFFIKLYCFLLIIWSSSNFLVQLLPFFSLSFSL